MSSPDDTGTPRGFAILQDRNDGSGSEFLRTSTRRSASRCWVRKVLGRTSTTMTLTKAAWQAR